MCILCKKLLILKLCNTVLECRMCIPITWQRQTVMVSFLKNSITTTGTERRLLRWGGIGWRLVLVLYLELSCCCKWLWKCDSRQTSRNVGYVHKSSHIWQKWRAYSGSRLGAWCRDGMGRWSTLTSLLPVVPITVVIECDVQSTCMVYALIHSIAAASPAETGDRDSAVRIFVDHYS